MTSDAILIAALLFIFAFLITDYSFIGQEKSRTLYLSLPMKKTDTVRGHYIMGLFCGLLCAAIAIGVLFFRRSYESKLHYIGTLVILCSFIYLLIISFQLPLFLKFGSEMRIVILFPIPIIYIFGALITNFKNSSFVINLFNWFSVHLLQNQIVLILVSAVFSLTVFISSYLLSLRMVNKE